MKIKIKNPIAMALKCAMFNRRIVKPKRGKGSYNRKTSCKAEKLSM